MRGNLSWPTFGGNPQHTGLGGFPVMNKPKSSYTVSINEKPGSGAAVDSKGICYFGTEDSFFAVKDGSIIWRLPLDYPVYGAPTLYEEKNILYIGIDKILALSMKDGNIEWKYKNNTGIFTCVPLLIKKHNLIVMVSQLVTSEIQYRLVALNAGTGGLVWEIPMVTLCSPCVSFDEETLYIGEENNKFYAISSSNGAIKWIYKTRGRIRTNPCTNADGIIYFVDAPDNPPSSIALAALNPDGSEKWRYYPDEYSNNSSPAIGPDGTIYVGFFGMHAVNADGTVKWKKREAQSFYCGSPVVDSVGNVIYSNKKNVLCYSSRGELLWALPDVKSYSSICMGPVNSIYYLNEAGITSYKAEYTPVITRIIYSGTDLFVQWNLAGYSDFVVTLYTRDGSVKFNIPASGCSTRIDRILDGSKTYEVVVTVLAEGEPVGVSKEHIVITKSPAVTQISYNTESLDDLQGGLDIVWEQVEDAQMYIAMLYDTDGTYKDNLPTIETRCRFPGRFDDGKNYRAAVTAWSSDGVANGPCSKIYEPIFKIVKSLQFYYTGTNLVADWEMEGEDLSFVCEMVKDNIILPEEITLTNKIVFNYGLEIGSIYKVHVRLKSGIVEGPWTDFSAGPYRTAITYEYDKAGRLIKATYNGKYTVAYDFDNSGNILKAEYSEVEVLEG